MLYNCVALIFTFLFILLCLLQILCLESKVILDTEYDLNFKNLSLNEREPSQVQRWFIIHPVMENVEKTALFSSFLR